jgi:hypothetical protein
MQRNTANPRKTDVGIKFIESTRNSESKQLSPKEIRSLKLKKKTQLKL